MSFSTNDNKSNASVTQGISLPDYFSCNNCVAHKWMNQDMRICDAFQREGRCRAAMLGKALSSGAVQIHLHLPVGHQLGDGS